MAKRDELQHILDENSRITRWPGRRILRKAALGYLAAKFEDDQYYTESAVNALLRQWHVFDDPALLRRELFDWGYINRTRDGRSYWRCDEVS
jgi:hypothetical protein